MSDRSSFSSVRGLYPDCFSFQPVITSGRTISFIKKVFHHKSTPGEVVYSYEAGKGESLREALEREANVPASSSSMSTSSLLFSENHKNCSFHVWKKIKCGVCQREIIYASPPAGKGVVHGLPHSSSPISSPCIRTKKLEVGVEHSIEKRNNDNNKNNAYGVHSSLGSPVQRESTQHDPSGGIAGVKLCVLPTSTSTSTRATTAPGDIPTSSTASGPGTNDKSTRDMAVLYSGSEDGEHVEDVFNAVIIVVFVMHCGCVVVGSLQTAESISYEEAGQRAWITTQESPHRGNDTVRPPSESARPLSPSSSYLFNDSCSLSSPGFGTAKFCHVQWCRSALSYIGALANRMASSSTPIPFTSSSHSLPVLPPRIMLINMGVDVGEEVGGHAANREGHPHVDGVCTGKNNEYPTEDVGETSCTSTAARTSCTSNPSTGKKTSSSSYRCSSSWIPLTIHCKTATARTTSCYVGSNEINGKITAKDGAVGADCPPRIYGHQHQHRNSSSNSPDVVKESPRAPPSTFFAETFCLRIAFSLPPSPFSFCQMPSSFGGSEETSGSLPLPYSDDPSIHYTELRIDLHNPVSSCTLLKPKGDKVKEEDDVKESASAAVVPSLLSTPSCTIPLTITPNITSLSSSSLFLHSDHSGQSHHAPQSLLRFTLSRVGVWPLRLTELAGSMVHGSLSYPSTTPCNGGSSNPTPPSGDSLLKQIKSLRCGYTRVLQLQWLTSSWDFEGLYPLFGILYQCYPFYVPSPASLVAHDAAENRKNNNKGNEQVKDEKKVVVERQQSTSQNTGANLGVDAEWHQGVKENGRGRMPNLTPCSLSLLASPIDALNEDTSKMKENNENEMHGENLFCPPSFSLTHFTLGAVEEMESKRGSSSVVQVGEDGYSTRETENQETEKGEKKYSSRTNSPVIVQGNVVDGPWAVHSLTLAHPSFMLTLDKEHIRECLFQHWACGFLDGNSSDTEKNKTRKHHKDDQEELVSASRLRNKEQEKRSTVSAVGTVSDAEGGSTVSFPSLTASSAQERKNKKWFSNNNYRHDTKCVGDYSGRNAVVGWFSRPPSIPYWPSGPILRSQSTAVGSRPFPPSSVFSPDTSYHTGADDEGHGNVGCKRATPPDFSTSASLPAGCNHSFFHFRLYDSMGLQAQCRIPSFVESAVMMAVIPQPAVQARSWKELHNPHCANHLYCTTTDARSSPEHRKEPALPQQQGLDDLYVQMSVSRVAVLVWKGEGELEDKNHSSTCCSSPLGWLTSGEREENVSPPPTSLLFLPSRGGSCRSAQPSPQYPVPPPPPPRPTAGKCEKEPSEGQRGCWSDESTMMEKKVIEGSSYSKEIRILQVLYGARLNVKEDNATQRRKRRERHHFCQSPFPLPSCSCNFRNIVGGNPTERDPRDEWGANTCSDTPVPCCSPPHPFQKAKANDDNNNNDDDVACVIHARGGREGGRLLEVVEETWEVCQVCCVSLSPTWWQRPLKMRLENRHAYQKCYEYGWWGRSGNNSSSRGSSTAGTELVAPERRMQGAEKNGEDDEEELVEGMKQAKVVVTQINQKIIPDKKTTMQIRVPWEGEVLSLWGSTCCIFPSPLPSFRSSLSQCKKEKSDEEELSSSNRLNLTTSTTASSATAEANLQHHDHSMDNSNNYSHCHGSCCYFRPGLSLMNVGVEVVYPSKLSFRGDEEEEVLQKNGNTTMRTSTSRDNEVNHRGEAGKFQNENWEGSRSRCSPHHTTTTTITSSRERSTQEFYFQNRSNVIPWRNCYTASSLTCLPSLGPLSRSLLLIGVEGEEAGEARGKWKTPLPGRAFSSPYPSSSSCTFPFFSHLMLVLQHLPYHHLRSSSLIFPSCSSLPLLSFLSPNCTSLPSPPFSNPLILMDSEMDTFSDLRVLASCEHVMTRKSFSLLTGLNLPIISSCSSSSSSTLPSHHDEIIPPLCEGEPSLSSSCDKKREEESGITVTVCLLRRGWIVLFYNCGDCPLPSLSSFSLSSLSSAIAASPRTAGTSGGGNPCPPNLLYWCCQVRVEEEEDYNEEEGSEDKGWTKSLLSPPQIRTRSTTTTINNNDNVVSHKSKKKGETWTCTEESSPGEERSEKDGRRRGGHHMKSFTPRPSFSSLCQRALSELFCSTDGAVQMALVDPRGTSGSRRDNGLSSSSSSSSGNWHFCACPSLSATAAAARTTDGSLVPNGEKITRQHHHPCRVCSDPHPHRYHDPLLLSPPAWRVLLSARHFIILIHLGTGIVEDVLDTAQLPATPSCRKKEETHSRIDGDAEACTKMKREGKEKKEEEPCETEEVGLGVGRVLVNQLIALPPFTLSRLLQQRGIRLSHPSPNLLPLGEKEGGEESNDGKSRETIKPLEEMVNNDDNGANPYFLGTADAYDVGADGRSGTEDFVESVHQEHFFFLLAGRKVVSMREELEANRAACQPYPVHSDEKEASWGEVKDGGVRQVPVGLPPPSTRNSSILTTMMTEGVTTTTSLPCDSLQRNHLDDHPYYGGKTHANPTTPEGAMPNIYFLLQCSCTSFCYPSWWTPRLEVEEEGMMMMESRKINNDNDNNNNSLATLSFAPQANLYDPFMTLRIIDCWESSSFL